MEQKPLVVVFEIKNADVFYGWGLERENIRCNHQLGIKGGLEGLEVFRKGRPIQEAVHQCIISLFNNGCGLMADINIPKGCPYEFYSKDSDNLLYQGRLRETQ